MSLPPLDPKEIRFVEAYMSGMSPAASKKAAGFPDNISGNSVLERPQIRAAVDRERAKLKRELKLDREAVLQGMMDALPMCATATEVVNVWREVGKIIGAYEPKRVKVELEGANRVKQLESLPTEKLLEMVEVAPHEYALPGDGNNE